MPFSLDALAAIATIVGTVVSIVALLQSSGWLMLAGLVAAGLSIGIGIYAHQKRSALASASMVIEGHSIDSLNIANLRRRVNRTFFIQEADHTIRITGEDMEITWMYSGFCRSDHVSSIEFSIDSDESTPFASLDCVAFDIGHDPEKRHPLRPTLVSSEGISKKVSVTFLEPLRAHQPFGVLLTCKLPRCLKAGFGYYTSTLSFAQRRVNRCVVRLTFVGQAPAWIRIYESRAGQPNILVKTLPPIRQENSVSEYIDIVSGRGGRSARVYAFWRDAL